MRLSVLIPVYNERNTLANVIAAVSRALPDVEKDIVIVDDLPHTATGKLLKMELRRLYGGESVPGGLKL